MGPILAVLLALLLASCGREEEPSCDACLSTWSQGREVVGWWSGDGWVQSRDKSWERIAVLDDDHLDRWLEEGWVRRDPSRCRWKEHGEIRTMVRRWGPFNPREEGRGW